MFEDGLPARQQELADLLPNSRSVICEGYGHFNDMENPQYPDEVSRFVEEVFNSGS